MSAAVVGALFGVAFILNLVWECGHARLYTTCRTMDRWPLARLLTWQSFKDAFWITAWYVITFMIYHKLIVFVFGLLVFSYAVERHAILTKRWEYAPEMPLVFGVGLSPLFELAITGVAAVYLSTFLGT